MNKEDRNTVRRSGGDRRNGYIDILRGIGIISIVVGHALITTDFPNSAYDPIREFLYYFHIPVFFFCSGYCWKEKKIEHFLSDILKKQYIPFVLVSLISILFSPVWVKMNVFLLEDIRWLYRIVTVLKFANGGIFTGPLWFVPFFVIAQFWYYLIHYIHKAIMKKCPNQYFLWVILEMLIIGILGITFVLIFGVGKRRFLLALTMTPLMKIGTVAKENWRRIEKILQKYYLDILLVSTIVLLIALKYEFQVELSKGILGGYGGILFYPVVFVGIVFCLSLATLMQKWKIQFIFESPGRMSFWIMALHCMVFKTIDGIVGALLKTDVDILTLFPYSFPALRLVYILFGVFFPILIAVAMPYFTKCLSKIGVLGR